MSDILMKGTEPIGQVGDSVQPYKKGETITLVDSLTFWIGYVRNSTAIRLFLPLARPIAPNANVSLTLNSTSNGIATVNGAVTLTGCSVSSITKVAQGLQLELSCASNSSLVNTTPVIAGFNGTITFS